MRLLTIAAAATALMALPLHAQVQVKDLPDNTVRASGTKFLKDGGGTLLVPTALLHFSATGSVYDEAKGGSGSGASAKTRFLTAGLDRAYLEGVARVVLEDLVQRLTAAGYKVVGWDDVKGDPDVAKLDRRKENEDWGMPTSKVGNNGRTYVVAAPSREQLFDNSLTGPTRQWRDIAKKHNAAILIPEYYFNAPDIVVGKKAGTYTAEIKVDANPSMRMAPALAWLSNSKGDGGVIQMAGLGYQSFLIDSVGTVALAKSQTWKPSLSQLNAAFQLDIDQSLFQQAALQHAANFNHLVAKLAGRERK
jgi:hypothetical protein